MNIIEKIKEIFNKMSHKTKKGIAIGGTIATVGIAAASCATDKKADVLDNNVKVEQGLKDNKFKEEMKVEPNELQTVENEIGALETKEEVLEYLKNMYIEQYKTMIGDTALTTENIELWKQYIDKVYVNKETGEMIPYDSDHEQVEQKLKEEGIAYDTEEDVEVYSVVYAEKNEMELIDCVTLQSKEGETVPVKVIIDIEKPYTSVLATMGTAIPDGLNCVEAMKQSNETDMADRQKQFINSVKKFRNTKDNQKIEEEKEGFEPGE